MQLLYLLLLAYHQGGVPLTAWEIFGDHEHQLSRHCNIDLHQLKLELASLMGGSFSFVKNLAELFTCWMLFR